MFLRFFDLFLILFTMKALDYIFYKKGKRIKYGLY